MKPLLPVLTLTTLMLCACQRSYDPAEVRQQRLATQTDGPIVIGLIDDAGQGQGFSRGVTTVFEMNGNMIGASPVKLQLADDGGRSETSKHEAQAFINNPDIGNVLGHLTADSATPASLQYEFNGINLLTPAPGPNNLVHKGSSHVFRLRPPTEEYSHELVRWAANRGYRHVLAIVTNDAESEAASSAFHKFGDALQIRITTSLTYISADPSGFGDTFSAFAGMKNDTVFIAAPQHEGSQIIAIVRNLGWQGPVLMLKAPIALESITGEVYVPELPLEAHDVPASFVDTYQKKFGMAPDTNAILGFEAAKAMENALLESVTRGPADIAEAMRATKASDTQTGPLFDRQGTRRDKTLRIMRFDGVRFVYVANKHKEEL